MEYMKQTASIYQSSMKQDLVAGQDVQSPLEKIAKSYTRMPNAVSGNYNIDKCNCGNCGCLKGNMLLILSPVGVAGTVSAFGPISAM